MEPSAIAVFGNQSNAPAASRPAKKSAAELNRLIPMQNISLSGAGRMARSYPICYQNTSMDLTAGGELPIFPRTVAVDSARSGSANPQKRMENHERSRRRIAG
jgi:hypothetical protein